jgi:hypothetical protein
MIVVHGMVSHVMPLEIMLSGYLLPDHGLCGSIPSSLLNLTSLADFRNSGMSCQLQELFVVTNKSTHFSYGTGSSM